MASGLTSANVAILKKKKEEAKLSYAMLRSKHPESTPKTERCALQTGSSEKAAKKALQAQQEQSEGLPVQKTNRQQNLPKSDTLAT